MNAALVAARHARALRRNVFVAFVLTFVEAVLALLLLRWGYRGLKALLHWGRRRIAHTHVI